MDAFIVDAKRTAIGRSHKDKGLYRNLRADELLTVLLRHFSKHVLPAKHIEDIYIGCVGQHLEQGKNIARLSALLADYPHEIPGVTLNRLCGSSLQAFNFAAMALHSGCAQTLLAGGVEHMHHVSMTAALDYNQELLDRFEFPFTNMGLTAEKVAESYDVGRQEQDEFALKSHLKATVAQKKGYFDKEIVPVMVDGESIATDQGPRGNSSLEVLGDLKPIFKDDGSVTAGNCSSINDGASLTLLANSQSCKKFELKKRAEVLGFSVVGLDPCVMGMGPVPAIKKLLKDQNLNVNDIDLFEINEAFASQAIASVRELNVQEEKLNPTGGAIALGHPLGSTGTRLITTLLNNLERNDSELGVVSMCVGHGQGMATLIRRC